MHVSGLLISLWEPANSLFVRDKYVTPTGKRLHAGYVQKNGIYSSRSTFLRMRGPGNKRSPHIENGTSQPQHNVPCAYVIFAKTVNRNRKCSWSLMQCLQPEYVCHSYKTQHSAVKLKLMIKIL